MHRRRVVLLGTGTGVGKTFIGRGLLKAWRRTGISTLALKPIESGLHPDAPLSPESDAGALCAAADFGTKPLYAFPEPVSPHLAAQLQHRAIDLGKVERWVHNEEDGCFGPDPLGTGGITLIETAGGVFSPLSVFETNLDLALRLQPALLVLVAPDALGVLHDVGAVLRALSNSPPTLVVLTASRTSDASTGRNAGELERVVFPSVGTGAPHDRSVISIQQGEPADFLADRILQRLIAP